MDGARASFPSDPMNRFGSPDEDHQPVTWLRGYPVYAAHLIVLVFAVSMVVTSVTMFLNVGHLFAWLPFHSELVLRGQVWRIFSYGLVNQPSLPFAFDMLFIAWFGREVEKFFGRRKFLWLYAGIYLATPLLFTLIGVWVPMEPRAGETGAFALFIAFALLYPGVEMMFGVLAKWAALILFGLFTLMALAGHDSTGLIALWATCGFAYMFVRYEQGVILLPAFNFWKRKPKLRVLPDLPATVKRTPPAPVAKAASMVEIDALLDKIAQSGMASLTPQERAKLDAARDDLMKKSGGR